MTSLHELAHELLDQARAASAGRAAKTIHGGAEHSLRQTVIAITEGHGLAAHESPGEATLHVLQGSVILSTPGDDEPDWTGQAGDFTIIPNARHALDVAEDSVVLLTVAVG